MKIGIDITPVIYDRGVSRYTSNLTRSLSEVKTDHQFTAFASSLRAHHRFDPFIPENFTSSLHHYPPKALNYIFNKRNTPIEKFTGDLDVFHAWDWYIPSTKKAQLVTTVHDLALFKFPKTAHSDIKKKHQQAITRVKQFNAKIIAVSESTKKDLINLFDIPEDNITVIYEALPQESIVKFDRYAVKKVRDKYTIEKPFLLCVGVHEPRKNYPNIIQAWKKYQKDYLLVIAGAKGWDEVSLDDGIITTGHISSEDLACLYTISNALVYTSLYEGFGLPILEAFHYATPVVTSNISSMPEVAGKAAVLVDPTDSEAIASGIEKALSNSDKYIQAGRKQLKKFSWEKTANQTLSIYQSLK